MESHHIEILMLETLDDYARQKNDPQSTTNADIGHFPMSKQQHPPGSLLFISYWWINEQQYSQDLIYNFSGFIPKL